MTRQVKIFLSRFFSAFFILDVQYCHWDKYSSVTVLLFYVLCDAKKSPDPTAVIQAFKFLEELK